MSPRTSRRWSRNSTSSRRSCSSTVLLGVLGRVGRQAIGGRPAPEPTVVPGDVPIAPTLGAGGCVGAGAPSPERPRPGAAPAASTARRRAARRTSCPRPSPSTWAAAYCLFARSVGIDAVLLQRELHDLGEHRRRDLAAVAQVVLVERDERREPRVVRRREADERRHRRRGRVAAGRATPSSRCRSCPRRRSPGSPRTRRCRCATTPWSICVITAAVFARHDTRSRGHDGRVALPLRVDRRVEQVRRTRHATVRDRRERVEHLHRR